MPDSSSLKSEMYREYSREDLSTSSSSKSDNPIAFTGSNDPGHKQVDKTSSRKNSFSSINNSFEMVRRSLSGQTYNTPESINKNLTVKDIYGDLDSDEINLQRELTRTTILNELVQRTQALEIENEVNDLEKNISYRPQDMSPTLPETSIPIEKDGEEFNKIDPELIIWDGPDDPDDPRNWKLSTKIYLLGLVSLYALVAPMSSSMLSPAMTEISKEFHIKSNMISAMVVSIQILAWAIGPLVLSPLSEHHRIGRKLVLDSCVWMSFFFNLGCAFSKNTAQIMVFRFLSGFFNCIPLNVCAGVISDLFEAKSRNAALASYSLAPLLGPCIAPVIAGFIVDHMHWRWVFYVLCMFNGFVAIVATIFFKETYSPTLLTRKANKLRKLTGNNNLHTIYDIVDGETTLGKIYVTVTRPIKLLFTHPMIIGLGSFMAFTYGFMYLMIVTFPKIFTQKYGFSKSKTGMMYIPMGIGFTLGVFFWTYMVGRVYNRLTIQNNGVATPEFRLPCLFAVSIIIPVGLVWFGWSVQKQLHWIMPGIGSAIFAFGLVCVFQTLQSYLIDMNTRHAASSVAAAALFRSLFGFSFPLFADEMYNRLNYGWANTMCAIIGLLLGAPFPIICFMYGQRIRTWANRRIERDQLKRDQKNLERLKRKNLKH